MSTTRAPRCAWRTRAAASRCRRRSSSPCRGASSYTYVEASRGQDRASWIESHARALEFFQGSPKTVVCDNLESAVQRPDRYEPLVSRGYREMADHYGTAVVPARPRKPRDKAKAEAAVLLAERWILAALRHRGCGSLDELNEAIRALLQRLNEKPFRKMPGSRRSRYEDLDRPALQPLPAERFEAATWKRVRAGLDYHVDVGGHSYSVPSELVGSLLDARVTARAVEVFHGGRRVASHPPGREPGGATTLPEHRPRAHREHLQWTPERLAEEAARSGPHLRPAYGPEVLSGRRRWYRSEFRSSRTARSKAWAMAARRV